jgi:hypothetical protein
MDACCLRRRRRCGEKTTTRSAPPRRSSGRIDFQPLRNGTACKNCTCPRLKVEVSSASWMAQDLLQGMLPLRSHEMMRMKNYASLPICLLFSCLVLSGIVLRRDVRTSSSKGTSSPPLRKYGTVYIHHQISRLAPRVPRYDNALSYPSYLEHGSHVPLIGTHRRGQRGTQCGEPALLVHGSWHSIIVGFLRTFLPVTNFVSVRLIHSLNRPECCKECHILSSHISTICQCCARRSSITCKPCTGTVFTKKLSPP